MQGLSTLGSNTPGLFFTRGWPNGNAPDETIYFEFRFLIPSGYQADLNHLTYAFGREDWAGNSGADNWELHMSYDAFDLHDELLQAVDTSAVTDYFVPGPTTSMTVNTDLTGLGTRTGEVWFRWYGYGGSGSPATGFIHTGGFGSNVTLDGELALVPEPTTMSLLALGSVLICRRNRKVNL